MTHVVWAVEAGDSSSPVISVNRQSVAETIMGNCLCSGSVHPHQSVTSSDHLLAGLPRGRSPSTIPTITVFTSRSSVIL